MNFNFFTASGEIGGFALTRLAEISPGPLYERGEILFTDKLLLREDPF
jgi:hypothetical protein